LKQEADVGAHFLNQVSWQKSPEKQKGQKKQKPKALCFFALFALFVSLLRS
jgi:hypothetical protein